MRRRPVTQLVALLGLFALGCIDPFAGKVWAKGNKSYAAPGEFERAATTCRREGGTREVAAGPPGANHFIRCMRHRGWVLVDAL